MPVKFWSVFVTSVRDWQTYDIDTFRHSLNSSVECSRAIESGNNKTLFIFEHLVEPRLSVTNSPSDIET